MFAGMSKRSMTTLRERRAELGLVPIHLWTREADRAAFAAAVEPCTRRAEALDPAQRPGRKRQEAARVLPLHLGRSRVQTPQGTPQKPAETRSTPRPAITLPCRLTFPTTPPAQVRNAMKADGWGYDRLTDTWTTNSVQPAEAWIEELTRDWDARIIGPNDG